MENTQMEYLKIVLYSTWLNILNIILHYTTEFQKAFHCKIS